MKKRRKLKLLLLFLFLIMILFFQSSLARYFYLGIHNFILESLGFYFNSSVLNKNHAYYQINNWDGVNDYSLTIDVNSKKNEKISTLSDVDYKIEISCSSEVTCTTDKNEGIIYQTAKTDSFIVNISPKGSVESGKFITVTIRAISQTPYQKTLEATYTIGVETAKFSYVIEDNAGSKYATLKLTNSVSFYQVMTAFDNYAVGDSISLDEYNLLPSDKKANCFSAKVKLSYPPEDLSLDLTNDSYQNAIAGSIQTKTIDNYQYVAGHTFYMLANSNTEIYFYKKDITQDYSYPKTGAEEKITVEVETAN